MTTTTKYKKDAPSFTTDRGYDEATDILREEARYLLILGVVITSSVFGLSLYGILKLGGVL